MVNKVLRVKAKVKDCLGWNYAKISLWENGCGWQKGWGIDYWAETL